jgi:hypothetical protein
VHACAASDLQQTLPQELQGNPLSPFQLRLRLWLTMQRESCKKVSAGHSQPDDAEQLDCCHSDVLLWQQVWTFDMSNDMCCMLQFEVQILNLPGRLHIHLL